MRHTSSTLRLSIWRIRFSEENDLRSVPNPGAMVLMLYRIRLMCGTLKGVIRKRRSDKRSSSKRRRRKEESELFIAFRMISHLSPRAPCNDCLSYIIVYSPLIPAGRRSDIQLRSQYFQNFTRTIYACLYIINCKKISDCKSTHLLVEMMEEGEESRLLWWNGNPTYINTCCMCG
jgi:hypothetical protein